MPVRTLGVLSLTKFIRFADVLDHLALLSPGATTAQDVHADPLLEPLWDDLLQYVPRPASSRAVSATAAEIVQDDELLKAARARLPEGPLLLWCALVFADSRLDAVVREVLTDSDGRFIEGVLNRDSLMVALANRPEFAGTKQVTNVLRNMDQAGIFVPEETGQTIVGVQQFLPTGFIVPSLLRLIQDRVEYWADDSRFAPASPAHALDFALALGANHWLGLTRDEFVRASRGAGDPAVMTARHPAPAEISELAELLKAKRQVVLQGPPGTGKTYLATAYIDWATSGRRSESRLQTILDALPQRERTPVRIADEVERLGLSAIWDIVQFHPSYEYNDFVRTLAAQPVPGGVTFVSQHRILSLIAAVGVELAGRNSSCELVLVLDELNRGNIPSIFGELLYALEYRGQPVATAYSVNGDASITIPKSLSIIGTMNTADRSIAVIDYALRRRFVFITVPATDRPLISHPGYVDERHRAAALLLFAAVHDALGGSSAGIQVGPSYYLPSGTAADLDEGLRELSSRFVYEVLPLLGEYALEGELDEGDLAALVGELSIDLTTPAHDQVDALHLALLHRTAPASSGAQPGGSIEEDSEPQ
ncbi:MAG TPA: AAA family ATPase [Humibacter sp.]|nr:AAA family ATPase [Humibacter sp.]